MHRAARVVLGVAVAVAAVAAVAGACAPGDPSPYMSDDGRLKIAATVSPITSIVARVVGDRADVRGLIPEGADSHTFEPPPSAARTLARADILFVNGLQLEDPTEALARTSLKRTGEIVALGDLALPPDQYLYDFSFPREGGKPNPHLWTNPPHAKEYARIVRDAASRRDPANAAAYQSNYEGFAAQVDALDRAMQAASATVPVRELLTYHDAYAYFARHYGWTVIGAIQVSSFEDPTPREVADLIRQVRASGVRAIFGSEVFPSKVLAEIGRETGARYVDELRDDDLPGRPGDPDHSWLGLMKLNFVTMVSSLGGDASAVEAVRVVDGAADGAGGARDRAEYPQ